MPTCCAHVLYVSAQQETALDWTPLIIEKKMTQPLSFSSGSFLFSTEAEISSEVKRKMILLAASRRGGTYFTSVA